MLSIWSALVPFALLQRLRQSSIKVEKTIRSNLSCAVIFIDTEQAYAIPFSDKNITNGIQVLPFYIMYLYIECNVM